MTCSISLCALWKVLNFASFCMQFWTPWSSNFWLYYIKKWWSNRCNICFAVVCCQNVVIITRADFLIYVIRHGDEALLGSSRWISGVKWKLDASEVGEGSTCLIAWLWSQTPFNMKSAIWVGIIRSRLNELSNVGLSQLSIFKMIGLLSRQEYFVIEVEMIFLIITGT